VFHFHTFVLHYVDTRLLCALRRLTVSYTQLCPDHLYVTALYRVVDDSRDFVTGPEDVHDIDLSRHVEETVVRLATKDLVGVRVDRYHVVSVVEEVLWYFVGFLTRCRRTPNDGDTVVRESAPEFVVCAQWHGQGTCAYGKRPSLAFVAGVKPTRKDGRVKMSATTNRRLDEYWGIGPKTQELLRENLGEEEAARAVEKSDVSTLTDAGLPRGRATRIVRHAKGGEGLDVLATSDTRDVYKSILSKIEDYAVTDEAADRVSVMTPFTSSAEARERLERVEESREAWRRLDQDVVLEAFEGYGASEASKVESALALLEAGAGEEFNALGALDGDTLEDAVEALRALGGSRGGVPEGADDELDSLREQMEAVERLEDESMDFVETLKNEVRDANELQEAFVDRLVSEADVTYGRVEEAVEPDPMDATDFVTSSLRSLLDDIRGEVEEREQGVVESLEEDVEENREEIDESVEAVREVAFLLTLARFADEHGMSRPEFVDEGVTVRGARNLDLETRGEEVQPVDYGVGRGEVAEGDVAVLTGANSGGKTTLLETVCETVLLASMGVPVPADEAKVSVFDSVVFHRRHSSFNAGVLESTLRSVVPPVTQDDDTLMLVDEFEAITEPGSAADLLHGLVTLTVERDATGVFVTHLADDLEPLPEEARVDGIFAEGLDDELELIVDYQPRFGTVGKSTPEFIVSRLLAEASDGNERAGFGKLARAVGVEEVQRTLDEVEAR